MSTVVATATFVLFAAAAFAMLVGVGVVACLSRVSVRTLREDR